MGETSTTSDTEDDTTLMAESGEELKSLLMRVKVESENWLKTQHSENEDQGIGPITSWQIEGGMWKQGQNLFSWAPKSLQTVTVAMKFKDSCSLEGKLWQTETTC